MPIVVVMVRPRGRLVSAGDAGLVVEGAGGVVEDSSDDAADVDCCDAEDAAEEAFEDVGESEDDVIEMLESDIGEAEVNEGDTEVTVAMIALPAKADFFCAQGAMPAGWWSESNQYTAI